MGKFIYGICYKVQKDGKLEVDFMEYCSAENDMKEVVVKLGDDYFYTNVILEKEDDALAERKSKKMILDYIKKHEE